MLRIEIGSHAWPATRDRQSPRHERIVLASAHPRVIRYRAPTLFGFIAEREPALHTSCTLTPVL